METILKRNQQSATVGTSNSVILGSNPHRKHLVISAPVPTVGNNFPAPQVFHNTSTASIGDAQTYQPPAGRTSLITCATCFLTTGTTQVLALEVTGVGGGNIILQQGGNQVFTGNIWLAAGQVIRWTVITAVAASTADLSFMAVEYAVQPHVTISFMGPAVLDQGINLYAGNAPLYLVDELVGRAFHEEINAIGSQSGLVISILELFGH